VNEAERAEFVERLTKLYKSNARRYGLTKAQAEVYIKHEIARRLREYN
jgi:hypothetical protein